MTMTTHRKTRLLVWLVILLVVMNAVTIGTILYHNYQERRIASPSLVLPGRGGGPNLLNGRFLRQELGFDAGQMEVFRDLNQRFRPRTMDISIEIDSLKELMFEKMQETVVDSLGIEELAVAIGEHHQALKSETFRFYQQLSRICSPDQKSRLSEIFRPLFINDSMGSSNGPRNGRGPGWRNPILNN